MQQRRLRKIASNLILLNGVFERNPLVTFDADSAEILSVEIGVEDIDRSGDTEFYSGIMLPGFINMHAHTELSYLKGMVAEGGGLANFAAQIGAVRNREEFTHDRKLQAIKAAHVEMFNNGIVAVADIVNGATSFESGVKENGDIEYRNFAEIFGLKTNNLESANELLKNSHTSTTQHSTYSLNDTLFKQIASQNIEHPLSIHFMESEAEAALYKRDGSLYEWYKEMGFECDFLHYGSPAKRLTESIPSERSVILVHNCFVTKDDIDAIMSHFAAPVYWVLCPESNRYISGIKPPIKLLESYRTKGGEALNICIGTDSLASANSLSILEQIRLMQDETIELAKMLTWATKNGAKALNLNHLGRIKKSKKSGINILSGVDYTTMKITTQSRIVKII